MFETAPRFRKRQGAVQVDTYPLLLLGFLAKLVLVCQWETFRMRYGDFWFCCKDLL